MPSTGSDSVDRKYIYFYSLRGPRRKAGPWRQDFLAANSSALADTGRHLRCRLCGTRRQLGKNFSFVRL